MIGPLKVSRTPPPNMSSIDRLSALPDEILHCVFFFLDFFDVSRISLLSKRWKSFWRSTPYLNFNMDWYLEHRNNSENQQLELPDMSWEYIQSSLHLHNKFWEFINSSLLLRDHDSEIIKICICCNNTISEQPNMGIRVAGWRNYPEIFLLGDEYSLIRLTFLDGASETLTILNLNFRDTNTLQFASSFINLRSLSLRRVCITSDAAKKLFSGVCVKLESILLEDCQLKDVQQIDISAINLKTITIVNVCTYQNFWVIDSFDCRIRISAPKLLSFCYVGPMLLGFFLVDTMSLRSITIRLMRVRKEHNKRYENNMICPERFIGFNAAEALTLSSLAVKYFCLRYGNTWGTFILDSARHLELEIRCKASFIEGMLNLLRCSPKIYALHIRLKKVRMPQKK